MAWHRRRVLEAHPDITKQSMSKIESRGGKGGGLFGGGGPVGGRGRLWVAYLQMPGSPAERQLWGCQLVGSLAGLTQQCSNR